MRLPLALVFTGGILLAQASRDLGVEFDAAPLPDKRDRWAVVRSAGARGDSFD